MYKARKLTTKYPETIFDISNAKLMLNSPLFFPEY